MKMALYHSSLPYHQDVFIYIHQLTVYRLTYLLLRACVHLHRTKLQCVVYDWDYYDNYFLSS